MSTMVVQERRLWLNLAEMKDVEKARFLDVPVTPSRALPSSSWSLLFLRRRREQKHSFPRWRAGRRILCFVLFRRWSKGRGWYTSPRTSGQSRLGPREFGEDASERTAFCIAHPYSLSLHHRYVDCAVGAACTASGGVAHAAQPVSLAHAHDSTRLRDSVHQATAQVQRRSRDIGGGPERPCLARGDCCPPGKGCNRADPSSRDEAGVSQPLLHRTQPILVVNNQSWIGESWTGLHTSSPSRCWRAGALSYASSPRIGLQRSNWRTLTFKFRSFCDTDRSYSLRSRIGHGSTGSSPSGSPCLPVPLRRS